MAKPALPLSRWPTVRRTLATITLSLLLSGCMVMSGETTSKDMQVGSGNLLTSFVSAEGSAARVLEVGTPVTTVQVLVILEVETGDLDLTFGQPDGTVAFSVTSRPGTQVTHAGTVNTDATGQLHYTVSARGARNGVYQMLVQP